MPVKPDLLEILCCPLTKTLLRILTPEEVQKINERVAAGAVQFESGTQVRDPLQEGLITVDNARIYTVRDNIPVMLVDESITTGQFGELFRN